MPVEMLEEMLLCLVALLCLLFTDPTRAGRGPVSPRVPPRASAVSITSRDLLGAKVLCSPIGFVSKLKSLVTPAMLLARSSKLGEGRNSKDELVFSSGTLLPLKEKREWLFGGVESLVG